MPLRFALPVANAVIVRQAQRKHGLQLTVDRRTRVTQEVPPLAQHYVEGARLFADRLELVKSLRPGAGGTVAEVGVAFGQFSDFLLKTLQPSDLSSLI